MAEGDEHWTERATAEGIAERRRALERSLRENLAYSEELYRALDRLDELEERVAWCAPDSVVDERGVRTILPWRGREDLRVLADDDAYAKAVVDTAAFVRKTLDYATLLGLQGPQAPELVGESESECLLDPVVASWPRGGSGVTSGAKLFWMAVWGRQEPQVKQELTHLRAALSVRTPGMPFLPAESEWGILCFFRRLLLWTRRWIWEYVFFLDRHRAEFSAEFAEFNHNPSAAIIRDEDGRLGIRICSATGETTLIKAAETGTPAASVGGDAARPQAEASMILDQAIWTISFEGKTVRVSDALGIRHLARIVAASPSSLDAVALMRANHRGAASSLEDPGRVFDAESADRGAVPLPSAGLDAAEIQQLRRTRVEAAEAVARAERCGDTVAADVARRELADVDRVVAAAANVHGRPRHDDASAARAARAVRSAIDYALTKVREYHDTLAVHLSVYVRRGLSCSYDPPSPCRWEVRGLT